MSIGTVFVNNRTQAVRLPLDVRLPEGVHKVEIRARGNERIIAPLGQTWDSFFLGVWAAEVFQRTQRWLLAAKIRLDGGERVYQRLGRW